MAGKYTPLGAYLAAIPQGQSDITLSFEQIESILGDKLPPSAHEHRAWWSNETDGQHVNAHAWMDAGWTADTVDQERGVIRFLRSHQKGPAVETVAAASPDVPRTDAATPPVNQSSLQPRSYLPPEAPLPTSGMAIASLITGILGFTMAPILGGIIAIFTGYAARRDTRAVPPRASGDGLATAGIVMGYVQIGLGVVGACCLVAYLVFVLGILGSVFASGHSLLLGLGRASI